MSRLPGTLNQGEIKVGLSVSNSGRFQLQGRQALNGILLWQSYANSHGGILVDGDAHFVRVIWYDDEGRLSRARENVLRLLQSDRVDILLGPYSSHLTMAAAEIAEDRKKILWNYGGTSDEIFGHGWQYIAGIASPASNYFRALPHWLRRMDPELQRICVLYSAKGTFGRQVNRGVTESAQETGQSVHAVALERPVEDCVAALSAIRAAKPEAVILAGSLHDELALLRTRVHWPRAVRIVACVAAGMNGFFGSLGADAEGVLGPSQWEPDQRFQPTFGSTSEWFTETFCQRFAASPDYVAAGAFAAGLIATECITRASSLDNRVLRSIISGLDGSTFYGRFRIDPRHGIQMGHQMLLTRWQRGKKVVLSSP